MERLLWYWILLTFMALPVIADDDAGTPEVRTTRVRRVRKVAEQPADALKPANPGFREQRAKEDAERARKAAKFLQLDAVANPLRELFGGVQVQPQAPMVVQVQINALGGVADDAVVQQFVQQNQPTLRAELGFVRAICEDLPVEQRPKIKQAADEALKTAAKQMANQNVRMQQLGAMRSGNNEPAKLIREALLKALKETLSPEKFAEFELEANERIATRKRAAIRSIISRLDGQLFLTDEQRDKIEELLTANWQEKWESWPAVMNMYGDRYFPNIPDQCVVPTLNTDQKVVWQGVQRIEPGNIWFGGMVQAVDADGWWGGEPGRMEENGAVGVEGGVIIERVFGF